MLSVLAVDGMSSVPSVSPIVKSFSSRSARGCFQWDAVRSFGPSPTTMSGNGKFCEGGGLREDGN